MRDLVDNQKFTCKDNFCIDAIIIVLIISVLVSISAILGTIYGVKYSESFKFVPDGILLLIGLLGPSIGLIALCVSSLHQNKTCIFSINNSTVSLNGKRRGEKISIERKTEEIKCIVIKNFMRIKDIVLVDAVGEIGHWASSMNGEFIKIRYSSNRLKALKKYLPNCPVKYSANTNMNELF